MRADHSCPQRGQPYQATTQVLSAAGETWRPQRGQRIAAATESILDMPPIKATIVPRPRRLIGPRSRVLDMPARKYTRSTRKTSHGRKRCRAFEPYTPVERVNRAHVGPWHGWCPTRRGPFAPSIRVNELLPRGTRNVLVAIYRRGIAAAARRALVSARGPRPRPDRDRTQDAALLRTAPAHQDGETALASSNGCTASSTAVSPRTVKTGHGAVRTTRSAMLPIRR